MLIKFLLSFGLVISFNSKAQDYIPVDAGSKIHFVIKNFGINTGGDFSGLKGNIHFSPDQISASKFDVTVAVTTIDTDNKMRDKNLVSDEYFDAEKFPVIHIVSTKIEKTNKTSDGFYFFNGTLTIKGVTKDISFPFQAKQNGNGFLFTGDFTIDRTAFGLGQKNIVLSNKVLVSLSVATTKH